MYTKTITPNTTTVTIELPEEFVGKDVRVTAYVQKRKRYENLTDEERLAQIQETYSKFPRTDMSKFKFDRDEANDFE